MDAAKAPGIFIHQYAGLPHGPAFEHWRERACGPCGLDIGPSLGDSIDCRLQISIVDNIALGIPEGPSAQYSRTQSGLADGNDDLVIECRYATGMSYKVIALVDGAYRDVRDTYFRSR